MIAGFVGPLATRNGGPLGPDFSVFLGPIVGSLVYGLLAGRKVGAEGAATLEPAA